MDKIIVENIGSQLAYGMTVYDSFGDKIGTVQHYDLKNGWFQTEKGILFPRDRYIPCRAIDRITPTGVYLAVTADYVKDMYDRPPVVEVDVAAAPDGAAAVATVASGYDGHSVVVDSDTISAVLRQLDNSLKVYDSTGEKIGRVYYYDPGSGWFVVEKGAFSAKDLYVPVTAVSWLDGDGVHLRVTKEVLATAFVVRPANFAASVVAVPEAVAVEKVDIDGSRRLVVDGSTLSLAIEHLSKGPQVYDRAGKEIGRVYQNDPLGGWIMVEKGVFSPTDLFIPMTAVEYLNDLGVHLRVRQDALEDAFGVQPANVTFVPTVG